MQIEAFSKRVLLILGSYAFSVVFVSFIHEVGHILAMFSVGVTQFSLMINPFTESYAMPLAHIPTERLLYLAVSGMVFQTIFFIIIGLLVWKKRSALMLPLMMCLPMSFINVGSYLLMGNLFDGSDVVLIVDAGVPILLVQIVGAVSLIIGIWVFTSLLSVAGFRKTDSGIEVFLPIFLGTGIYSMAMLVYGYFSGNGTMIGSMNIVSSLLSGIVYTLIFKKTRINIDSKIPSTMDSVKTLGIGLATIILTLIFF